jgi:hypothetical protein
VSDAAERVAAYLKRKRETTQIDPATIHGFGMGDGTTLTLYTADLEELVELARHVDTMLNKKCHDDGYHCFPDWRK